MADTLPAWQRIVPESELREKALAADAEGKAFCVSCYRSSIMCCGHFDECGFEEEFARLIGRKPKCLPPPQKQQEKE